MQVLKPKIMIAVRLISSFNGSGCKDESMLLLEEKCKQLEDGNFELLNEVCHISLVTSCFHASF